MPLSRSSAEDPKRFLCLLNANDLRQIFSRYCLLHIQTTASLSQLIENFAVWWSHKKKEAHKIKVGKFIEWAVIIAHHDTTNSLGSIF